MGVRILHGQADGTRTAAAMYDSTSGWMVGPIWEAEDAVDQIEAFCGWLRRLGHVRAVDAGELELEGTDLPRPGKDGGDPRQWPDVGLEKVVVFWRSRYVDEDGLLRLAEAV